MYFNICFVSYQSETVVKVFATVAHQFYNYVYVAKDAIDTYIVVSCGSSTRSTPY